MTWTEVLLNCEATVVFREGSQWEITMLKNVLIHIIQLLGMILGPGIAVSLGQWPNKATKVV